MNQRERRQHALTRHAVRIRRRLNRLRDISDQFSWLRLGVFFGGVVVSFTAYYIEASLFFVSVALWMGAFALVARAHRRVKDSIARHEVWLDIKSAQVARMALDWDSLPPAHPDLTPRDAALSLDLDLYGDRALHRLIDTSTTREGSQRLLDWLATAVPDLDAIARRQALVRELIPLPVFRDKLQMYATLATKSQRWEGADLAAWLKHAKYVSVQQGAVLVTGALALLNIVLLVLGLARVIPMLCFGSFLIYVAVYAWSARGANTLIKAANTILDPLRNLGTVLGYLEKYRYGRNEGLHALCTPFVAGAHRPSAELRRLTWVVAGASIRGNPFLWILVNAVVPWDLFIAYLLERRKRALAQMVPQWLDVWYELEALCALANLAYLNPAYTFPCIVAGDSAGEGQTGRALLEARALGHPLIPEADRVCNDFAIAGRGELALITGSNMSGKSTFLRTLGINLCLAYAGGPVNAQSLHTAPVRLFTVIRVTDSVSEGISYFYAEVKRLRALLEALEAEHPAPVFYLIDEIFKGTNNRERLIGSRSYIRTLVRHNGVGALSTHDLELVSLADEIPQIKNYHFTESVADGRMHFDYTLRPGPSPTTNALKIMRMEGLPVEPPA